MKNCVFFFGFSSYWTGLLCPFGVLKHAYDTLICIKRWRFYFLDSDSMMGRSLELGASSKYVHNLAILFFLVVFIMKDKIE